MDLLTEQDDPIETNLMLLNLFDYHQFRLIFQFNSRIKSILTLSAQHVRFRNCVLMDFSILLRSFKGYLKMITKTQLEKIILRREKKC